MRGLILALGLSAGLITCALVFRPILPIDETRYLSVAWEMQWRGDYLVSHMSGHTYSHKPPLLFWLINAVWVMFGESATVARLVAPSAGLVCLLLVRLVARGFWPDDRKAHSLAPVLMAATLLWCIFEPMTMFDTLVTVAVLTSTIGLQWVCRGAKIRGWLTVGLAIGLGLLAKGPVILLFVIPGSFAIGWWHQQVSASQKKPFWLGWSLATVTAILLGASIILAWAIPSAIAGGDEYAHDLFLGQTAGRMVKSFAHKRPVYWYLPFLPVCALPWIAYRPVWHTWQALKSDRTLQMLLGWMTCTFVLFSLVSGKQLHYILPLVPLWTLVIARTISTRSEANVSKLDLLPVMLTCFASMLLPLLLNHVESFSKQGLSGLIEDWTAFAFGGIGLLTILFPLRTLSQQVGLIATCSILWSCTFLAGTANYWQGCDLTGLAAEVRRHELPVVWYGDNQAQLNFLGRIRTVEQASDADELANVVQERPETLVVFPNPKVRRSARSPATGSHAVEDTARIRSSQITEQFLKKLPDYKAELIFVYTRNRELYTEDYYLLKLTR